MPATFLNPSFETAGTGPGAAASWTITVVATAEQDAAFDADPESLEDFEEGWSSNEDAIFELEGADVSAPFVETFTEWAGAFYMQLPGAEAAVFDTVPESIEDFEEGWQNDSYVFAMDYHDDAAATYGTFDGNVEAFDSWGAYLFDFVGVGTDLELGTFPPTGTTEDFRIVDLSSHLLTILTGADGPYGLTIGGYLVQHVAASEAIGSIAESIADRVNESGTGYTATAHAGIVQLFPDLGLELLPTIFASGPTPSSVSFRPSDPTVAWTAPDLMHPGHAVGFP